MHECNPGKKASRQQWNTSLDAVVIIIKYKKSIFDHAVYIKAFSDATVSYITVSTYDVLNNTYNETAFTEPRKVFELF